MAPVPPLTPDSEDADSVPKTEPASNVPNSDTVAVPQPPAPVWRNEFDFLSQPKEPNELGRLGPYRVLGLLGHGSMGVVFRPRDTVLDRDVALKVMLPKHAAHQNARRRFLREARAQAAVEHVNVIPIFEVGEVVGVPLIVMPLLKGQTLGAALKGNPTVPMGEILRIGREMAEGLAAAHERGLIHRDIKPSNV